ncbi:helix-turn-helix domain-containing protein [Priestia megaterium]|uniref:helix-turn-helix domain-containing protein n=1 Tax=Priestia megaterium TaxID=1404 RepID=UPI002E1A5167|nr:helix-turn-helix domain-containing protein [Priestia megaterium]MED3982197.1 hypothetical protein [Priestia megaterium]
MELTVVETSKKGRNAYIDSSGNLYLDCKTCNTIKHEDEFCVSIKRFKGRGTNCKACSNNRVKKWYSNEENKVTAKKRATEWNRQNKHKRKPKPTAEELKSISMERYNKNLYAGHVYRARKRNMLYDFDEKDYEELMTLYSGGCCLTGDTEIDLDHVIPLAVGHGGTTFGNMIPLSSKLNSSKQAYNIFEWAEFNYERLGFDIKRFNVVMAEIAGRNDMTLEEYREYYYWCFEHPREIPTHYNGSNYYISFTKRLAEAIKLYNKGALKKEIVDATNISETTLYKHLKIRGIETRRPSIESFEERMAVAIEMYKEGVILRKIYKVTRIHKKSLFNRIDELGIPKRHPTTNDVEDRIETAVEMYKDGQTVTEILLKNRIGKKILYNTLDNLGIPRRRSR